MGNITVYKLTTQDNKTRKGEFNECTWGPGVSHSGTGHGDLCGPGYIHAYLSPLLAVFLNPIHANIPSPKLWECSVSAIAKSDKGLKVGAITLTTEKEIPLPSISARQRVIFAILCAEKAQESTKHLFGGNKPWQVTYRKKMKIFFDWAEDYKQGRAAAYAAARAADAAAYAADAAPKIDLSAIAAMAATYK